MTQKDNILGRNKTRLELWEEHLKDPVVALDKSFEVRGESVSRQTVGSRAFVKWLCSYATACGRGSSGTVPKMWDIPLWESVWPCLDPWDSVRLRTASTHWNVPGKYGPHGEFFFLSEEADRPWS